MNRVWSRYGLVVLVVLLISEYYLHYKYRTSPTRAGLFSTFSTAVRHPIESLTEVAQATFASLRERQSKTLEQAEIEYHRRYGRDPPPGFQAWFRYAVAHNSVLVDDFDQISHNVKPFWEIDPVQLRESVEYVASLYPGNLERREIRNGIYYGFGDGWASHTEDLAQLLEDVVQYIPDVVFVVNTLDEPREIIGPTKLLREQHVFEPEFSENPQMIWSSILDSCADDDWDATTSIANNTISFIYPSSDSIASSQNPCHHASLALQHGIFTCPVTTSITNSPVPILSQAAPLGFDDVLYPTFWYLDNYRRHAYSEAEDLAWADKTNTLYWAGSTTGEMNGVNWRYGQRPRFVEFAEQWKHGLATHAYLEKTGANGHMVHESRWNATELGVEIDVKFTAVVHCVEPICGEMEMHFHPSDREPLSQAFKSRFLFDLDGNSFSSRYYTLLQSHSVVLKQTVFREWHDERLVPWVHYVPISMGLAELPEILRWFASDEGTESARAIAEQGRDWQQKALRPVDFKIYMWRLLLELARVLDPDREP
jgi:hypothetical protein